MNGVGRGYKLLYGILAGAVLLAGAGIITNMPIGNLLKILEWYSTFAIALVGGIGLKELGKVGKSWAERKKAPPVKFEKSTAIEGGG